MGIDRDARTNVGAFSEGQRRYSNFTARTCCGWRAASREASTAAEELVNAKVAGRCHAIISGVAVRGSCTEFRHPGTSSPGNLGPVHETSDIDIRRLRGMTVITLESARNKEPMPKPSLSKAVALRIELKEVAPLVWRRVLVPQQLDACGPAQLPAMGDGLDRLPRAHEFEIGAGLVAPDWWIREAWSEEEAHRYRDERGSLRWLPS